MPWLGGGGATFEHVIGLMKSAFYKTVGQGILNWEELSEAILNIEVTMTNCPLCYQEDDVQLPTLGTLSNHNEFVDDDESIRTGSGSRTSSTAGKTNA